MSLYILLQRHRHCSTSTHHDHVSCLFIFSFKDTATAPLQHTVTMSHVFLIFSFIPTATAPLQHTTTMSHVSLYSPSKTPPLPHFSTSRPCLMSLYILLQRHRHCPTSTHHDHVS